MVIGGGAAGLSAALFAARAGAAVTMIDKNEKFGKKLYITGKGRCNLCNACDTEEFLRNVPRNPRFLYSALRFLSPDDLQRLMEKVERESANNTGITICIALNYGGRAEIVNSARELARMAAQGKLDPDSIDESLFESYLYTGGIPDPDLLIRPSGELRLSNFLLWQLAYTEFVFQDVLWPDFTTAHLDQAIDQYTKRNRRFGGI